MKHHVIYHDSCADGHCAAWIARNALLAKGVLLEDITFTPAQYGQSPPECNKGASVWILDFSYKRGVLLDWADRCQIAELVILDHHQTAEAELQGLEADLRDRMIHHLVRFDMKKSGGRLTWEFFHGDNPAPWLVQYTEDRDLWRWALPQSREINAALRSYPMTFDQWNVLCNMVTVSGKRGLYVEGRAILRADEQTIANHVKKAVEIDMDGHKVLCVNATTLISEIAGELAKGRAFGVCYFIRGDGAKVYSLRSREGGIDVSEIAKRHGGGGHRQAAGWTEGGK